MCGQIILPGTERPAVVRDLDARIQQLESKLSRDRKRVKELTHRITVLEKDLRKLARDIWNSPIKE